jgi:hypothetical protein
VTGGLGAVRLVVAADWSVASRKRWMALAARARGGRFRAGAARPVGDPRTLLARVARRTGAGAALVGFDFPIGVPSAYAERAGIAAFVPWLRALGRAPWDGVLAPARAQFEIGIHRPFYPAAARRRGEALRAHLCTALGVERFASLRRRCDEPAFGRGAAEVLFWTVGGKQVGKAAIAGWREVIQPAVADRDRDPDLDPDLARRVSLWPFDGPLAALAVPGRVVVAEIYPADAYRRLGIARVSKRDPASRRAACAAMARWMTAAGVAASPVLAAQLAAGFGPRQSGEDPFDAVAALLGMLDVVIGRRPLHEPDDPIVRTIEGWILGLDAGVPRAGAP